MSRKIVCAYCETEFMGARRGKKPAVLACSLACRFWLQVDKRGDDECWPWLGKLVGGYPYLLINRTAVMASHVALELEGRPLPYGKRAQRNCGNRLCVNARHLGPLVRDDLRRMARHFPLA